MIIKNNETFFAMFFTFNHTTNEDFTLSADFANFIENNGILFIQVGENNSFLAVSWQNATMMVTISLHD